MKEVYVHTLRYHHHGRGNRRSRIMFPISYGPFKDEESAWEWVRRSGITYATKLMSAPARENVEVPHQHLSSMKKDRKFSSSLGFQTQPEVGD
jgi:hypothetical protein